MEEYENLIEKSDYEKLNPNNRDSYDIAHDKSRISDFYSIIGGRVMRRLRLSKNMGQNEAAVESNFSYSYLSNVERGAHNISLGKFLSFCDGVNSTPEELCKILCEEIAQCKKDIYFE